MNRVPASVPGVVSILSILLFAPPVLSRAEERVRYVSLDELEPFAEFVNEVSERRRRVVYIPNQQTIFHGVRSGFVNVGKGNLTFLRRDLVAIDLLPIVVARVYDSSSAGATDFGPGWHLALAESIELDSPERAVLRDETASAVHFSSRDGKHFSLARPQPTDIERLTRVSDNRLRLALRDGLVKIYRREAGRFRLHSVIDRNSNELRFRYSRGLLTGIASSGGRAVDIERYEDGRIETIADDQGRRIRYAYDQRGLLREVTDLGGHRWTYEYGSDDRLSAAVGPLNSMDIAAFYDDAGRAAEVFVRGEPAGYAYGEELTRVTDARGHETRFLQTAEGITHRVENHAGVVSELELDDRNRVRRLSNNSGEETEFRYSKRGRLRAVSKSSAAGKQTIRIKYRAGKPHQVIANDEVVAAVSYDASGNVSAVQRGADRYKYAHDAAGRLLSVSSPQYGQLSFHTNAHGQITFVQDEFGRSTELSYFADGKLESVTFPDATRQKYEYSSLGTRNQVAGANGGTINYDYTAEGSLWRYLRVEEDDSSASTEYVIDEQQRLIRIVSDDSEYVLSYDESSELTGFSGPGIDLSFDYDDLHRLVAVGGSGGATLGYRYQAGEADIRRQVDTYTRVGLSGRVRSGAAFATLSDTVYNRVVPTPYDVVYLDAQLAEFRITSKYGFALADELVLDTINRLRLARLDQPKAQTAQFFSAPSNAFFIPPEFWAINCNTCPPLDPRSVPIDADPILVQLAELNERIAACPPGGPGNPNNGPIIVKYTIIIPLDHIRQPEAIFGGHFFGADNIRQWTTGKSYRTQLVSQVRLGTTSVTSTPDPGRAREYAPSTQTLGSGSCLLLTTCCGYTNQPLTHNLCLKSNAPTFASEDAANMTSVRATYISKTSGSITLRLQGAPRNPLTLAGPLGANVDWYVTLAISRQNNGSLRVVGSGFHDGFPQHEIEVAGHRVYKFVPWTDGNPGSSRNPLELLSNLDHRISFTKIVMP